MQLRRLASPQSAGWAGRLETQGRANAAAEVQRLLEEFFLTWGKSLCFYKAVNWLDKALPHYEEQTALLKSPVI